MSPSKHGCALLLALGCSIAAVPGTGIASVEMTPSPLLAIDQNRATVVNRIVAQWGQALAQENAGIGIEQLRDMLLAMRSDQLLAASLAGNLEGLRNVVAASLVTEAAIRPSLLRAKALGDVERDVVYVPVVPCRLVETRGTFPAVYQGGGPFTTGQVRTYTLQGGNGVCLGQLPASVSPSAIQLQVYGIPTSTGSGDIEVLPQGSAFGSTATLVYLGNNAFTSSSTTSLVNTSNKQISVQVRGAGAHVAIDVVGFFRAPDGGFVSSVTAGNGLTGGGTGAVALAVDTATIQSRVAGTCAAGSSIRVIAADGAVTCQPDANSGGTVTSVGSGTGLTGGPITTSGTLSADTTYLQRRVGAACAVGSSIRAIAADGTVTCQVDSGGPGNAFVQGGNAFGATAVLGTTDANALDIRANNARVMRYEPNAISPNVLGGSPANSITAGVRGGTIGGGGVPAGNTDPDLNGEAPNRVTAHYGTVGGGYANVAGNSDGSFANAPWATVGGGHGNVAGGNASTVGGGNQNTASIDVATVAGGNGNVASGVAATVGGGGGNTSSGQWATVAGGFQGDATGNYSTVGGGFDNVASGLYATVPGGFTNVARGNQSWAGGTRSWTESASGTAHTGAFAWSGGDPFGNFRSTAPHSFNVLATGGLRFITAATVTGGEVAATDGMLFGGDGMLRFGVSSPSYGPKIGIEAGNSRIIGNQASTMYFRTNNSFAWFEGGAHSDAAMDPGTGGNVLATLRSTASSTAVNGVFRAMTVTATSDREQKTAMVPADPSDVLARLVSMPISTWAYKTEHEAGHRHIGPTAQDFRERFGLGYDDKSIATIDADGVALAAIQGLNAKLEAAVAQRDAKIAELERAIAVLLARTSPDGRLARAAAAP